MSLPLFTIGFASHRLETLPLVLEMMRRHEAMVLEEAPEPDFPAALAGGLAPDAYLEDKDPEFPEFSLRQLEALRGFQRDGGAVLQVEPYLERLLTIHELLAQGVPRPEVEFRPDLAPVYAAERRATASLLTFYTCAHGAEFDRVVAAVRSFAREDAARLRLRDELRAAALAPLVRRHRSLYVEAGYIHLFLLKGLKAHLGGAARLRPVFLQSGPSRAAVGLPRPLGPGDLLTLHHIFDAPLTRKRADLLAARSLIHIQLLEKEELAPTPGDPTPHLEDEFRAFRLSGGLRYQDCAHLYPLVRAGSPAEVRQLVADFLAQRA
ncbi:MAG: hypothetical protein FJ128_02655 [Deltaproteobacteria bacterium]|nr:hypothetical protein [Deltaproteobacteria bacterium]